LEAIHSRHVDVEHHHVRGELAGELQPLLAVGRGGDVVPRLLEDRGDGHPRHPLVVDDENSGHYSGPSVWRRREATSTSAAAMRPSGTMRSAAGAAARGIP